MPTTIITSLFESIPTAREAGEMIGGSHIILIVIGFLTGRWLWQKWKDSNNPQEG